MTNARLQAFHILHNLLEHNVSLQQGITSQTLPFARELCYTFARQYFRLKAAVGYLVKKSPDHCDELAIMFGICQLEYLNVKEHAAVSETVALLDSLKRPAGKAFVNAVLRNYLRNRETIQQHVTQHVLTNHPAWLVKKLKKAWPLDFTEILAANDRRAPMTLRVNKQQYNATSYQQKLHKGQIESRILHAEAIELAEPINVSELPEFATGAVSVQDLAAQFAAELMHLEPGLRVLDAASAPGGKLCHMLELEPDLDCTAIDIDKRRTLKITENLQRLKLNATIITGDASKPDSWWDNRLYDRILLDAPCSATGVIRRHPDIKLLRTKKDVDTIIKLQAQLLTALWPLLKPGGIMVYATCSVLPEENDAQIQNFLITHPDCQLLFPPDTIISYMRATGHGWQILPGTLNMDGFFYSILLKLTL